MSNATLEAIERDKVALGVAQAIVVANDALTERGVDLADFFVRIDESVSPKEQVWTVHYIPRDYLQCRGGDWEVTVDAQAGKVTRILRGQ